jgi:hypothetical protein
MSQRLMNKTQFSKKCRSSRILLQKSIGRHKGKSLVSQYEVDNDAQTIYCELKKHDKSSTATWLAGGSLLYPREWRGTSFRFVLHWQEQLAIYKELVREITPPKQK